MVPKDPTLSDVKALDNRVGRYRCTSLLVGCQMGSRHKSWSTMNFNWWKEADGMPSDP